jgi:hypothetical protein
VNDEMKIAFYEPDKPVSGASYSLWFKLLATLVTIALAVYGVDTAARFPFQMKR